MKRCGQPPDKDLCVSCGDSRNWNGCGAALVLVVDDVSANARAAKLMEVKVRWRVGRKLGRTLYIGDRLVGMLDTPELASAVVAAMNAVKEEK